MTRDKLLAAAALAVSLGVLVSLSDSDVGERPLDDGRTHHYREATLIELPDAGKGYVYPSTLTDGGAEWLVTSEAPCVRARPDGGQCLRREADGGARDFGVNNRFPREDAVGNGCQPVACLVTAGDDADEDEDVRLERERSKRDAGG